MHTVVCYLKYQVASKYKFFKCLFFYAGYSKFYLVDTGSSRPNFQILELIKAQLALQTRISIQYSMYIVAEDKHHAAWVLRLFKAICTVGVNTSLYLEISLFNLEIKFAQLLEEKNNEVLSYLLRCLVSIWGKQFEGGLCMRQTQSICTTQEPRIATAIPLCRLKRY